MSVAERLGTTTPDLGPVVVSTVSGLRARRAAHPPGRPASEELFGQLRSSGVRSRRQVRAVVLETTGDLSVITGDEPIDVELLRGVRGGELLR